MKIIKNYNQFRLNEYNSSINPDYFNIKLDYLNIDIESKDYPIDTVSATVKYKIEMDFGRTGIKGVIPHDISAIIDITFEDESVEEYAINNIESSVVNNELPFEPTELKLKLVDKKIVESKIIF